MQLTVSSLATACRRPGPHEPEGGSKKQSVKSSGGQRPVEVVDTGLHEDSGGGVQDDVIV